MVQNLNGDYWFTKFINALVNLMFKCYCIARNRTHLERLYALPHSLMYHQWVNILV
ncbi:hypothetical protein HanIR_Chr10g0489291 [Helianthus annuus]|nr:hypothetical protein HanIR_Chr10g0489291 [Helianthus annuus]